MKTTKICLLFLFLFVVSASNQLNAEEAPQIQQPPLDETVSSMVFSVSIEKLAETASADEVLWFDTNTDKHLLLKHRTKGRKERGNILLLHAQSENADHTRLIQPFARQLSRLGWNIFIPNIAKEDFPKNASLKDIEPETKSQDNKNNSEELKSEQEGEILNQSKEDLKQYTFSSSQEYQNYYVKLCQAILEQTDISKAPLVIIANQNAAYWALECIKFLNKQTPVVLLQPQLPKGIKDNLSEIFAAQSNPIFSFHPDSEKNGTFTKTFKKRLWRSRFQRFNVGMLSSTNLQEEDSRVAKTITGWVEKQRKK